MRGPHKLSKIKSSAQSVRNFITCMHDLVWVLQPNAMLNQSQPMPVRCCGKWSKILKDLDLRDRVYASSLVKRLA